MRLGLSLVCSTGPGHDSLELLGLIVQRAIAFAKSGFDPAFVYDDCVGLETVPASDAFTRDPKGKIWLLCQDRLPFDATIQAVGIDRRQLFIETAPIDMEAVMSMIADERSDLVLTRCTHGQRKGSYELRTPRSSAPLAVLIPGAQEEIPTELGPRWLTIVHWTRRSAEDIASIAWLIDQTHQQNLYVPQLEESGSATAVPISGMKQQQVMDIQMQQQPHLMLNMGISGQMRTELQAMLVLQQTLLRLPEAELPAFVARSFKERGVEGTFRVIRFVLAGRIKRAHPHLTWPEARARARGAERKIRAGR